MDRFPRKKKKGKKKRGKKFANMDLPSIFFVFKKKKKNGRFFTFSRFGKKIAGWAESGLALNWQDSVGKCYNKVSLLFHWSFAFVEHAYHFIPPFIQGLSLFYCFERIFILFIKHIPRLFDLHRIILSLTLTCNQSISCFFRSLRYFY